jgi:hypothetical protein
MSKVSELEEWKAAALRYRQLALLANNGISRKMLESLASEAEAMAKDIEDREPLPKPRTGAGG